jgi:thiazolinyl imide reductase
VVSTAVGGGRGAELAKDLLERGIHARQEHPVHSDELADCLRVARGCGTQYLLNTCCPHLEPVRRFTSAAREPVRLCRPVFVDALRAMQVAFDLLDILAGIFDGLRPWSITGVGARAGRPLVGVDARIAGVPLTLRVENRMQAGDDSTSLFLHRITIGADAGNLMLADTHGPVIWSPVLRLPSNPEGRFFPGRSGSAPGWADDSGPTGARAGPAGTPTWEDAVHDVWGDGVPTVLDEARTRRGGRGPAARPAAPSDRGPRLEGTDRGPGLSRGRRARIREAADVDDLWPESLSPPGPTAEYSDIRTRTIGE